MPLALFSFFFIFWIEHKFNYAPNEDSKSERKKQSNKGIEDGRNYFAYKLVSVHLNLWTDKWNADSPSFLNAEC